MSIKEISNKKEWQDFFDKNDLSSFLQSWEWGELQQRIGESILRLGIYDDNKLICIAQVIKIKAKRGNFLFIPHGPIIQVENAKCKAQNYLKQLKDFLIKIAKEEGFDFIRVGSTFEDTEENRKIFKDLGFRNSPIYLHAERVWVLSLTDSVEERSHAKGGRSGKTESVLNSDDELLSKMRKTTRYLIKKAVRDGVVIEKRTDEKAIDDFWTLYQETAKRENFHPFSKQFIEEEFKAFNKTGNAVFLFARVITDSVEEHGGKTESVNRNYLASALIIFTKSCGFYHQGASVHSKIPATYLLQWEAIKEAKKRGCALYNFWGTFQPGRTPKNWGGLTLFKTGFGGRQIDYVTTQDYILSPKYYLTYLYEKFLSFRRGV